MPELVLRAASMLAPARAARRADSAVSVHPRVRAAGRPMRSADTEGGGARLRVRWVALCGGASLVPGLRARLQHELRQLSAGRAPTSADARAALGQSAGGKSEDSAMSV